MNIPVQTEENSSSEEKAKRPLRTDTRSQQSITATTSAEDVLIETNAISPRMATEQLK